ncbi:aprataxin and PNK-like factor isoform X2 [Chiroxiphia lanceolata]|uniref:aprataxin and PNK-like factor isoform X2 n=1 Tax=Chiroxiphia lanceolata TaxID=296741 RepID=UPI0013CE871B|nr:aprataxin and PNK-like factor isoform X2 [Chiroxiphia lanceolata]
MTRCQPLHAADAWHRLSTSRPPKIRELTSGGRADTKSPCPPPPPPPGPAPAALSRPPALSASIPAAPGRGGVTAAAVAVCWGCRGRQRPGLGVPLPCPCRPGGEGTGSPLWGRISAVSDPRSRRLAASRGGRASSGGGGGGSYRDRPRPGPAEPRAREKTQEADAEEAPTVHAVEMSCIPLLMEPSCSSSEVKRAAKMRNYDAASRNLVPLSDDNDSEQSKSIQRKRVLPSWMLEGDLLVQRVSEPIMTAGHRKKKGHRRGESVMESLKSEVNVQQKKRLASGETVEHFEGEEQDEGKRSCFSIPVPSSQNTSGFPLENTTRDMEGNGKTGTKNPGSSLEKNDRQPHSKCSKRVGQTSSKDNRIEKTENKEQSTGSTSQQAHWGGTSQYCGAQEGILEPDANMDCETEISDSTRSADASESSKKIQHKRTPCMYGSACYRKNPIHFQQFSHPNDDDYHDTEMISQDNNDNRPECPYGTACYRKNPQHKLEYKHTAPPGTERGTRQRTSRNGKRAVEKDSANDGEANEYDLNDSFIDDEEEECEATDEDSDWEPSSEEKDNEDVETLVQEAGRFVKTKK